MEASPRAIAARYVLNPKTVAKWRKRNTVENALPRPNLRRPVRESRAWTAKKEAPRALSLRPVTRRDGDGSGSHAIERETGSFGEARLGSHGILLA